MQYEYHTLHDYYTLYDQRQLVPGERFIRKRQAKIRLKDTSNHFRTDLDKLSDSADGALKPLKSALENVAGLSADLEKQMAAGGDVAGTFHQLDLAVGNVNTLIEDPNIQKILANSADTSQHLAESAKSVDLAMRPWRERAHFLKTILLKAIGMVKFVYPL